MEYRPIRRLRLSSAFWVAALLGAVAPAAGCGSDRNAGSIFRPVKSRTLTVATAFVPTPGFWEGSPPTSGFEAALAKELASRLGLDAVVVKQVPFAALAGGDLGGADIALSQLTPTEEREKSLDFTAA